MWMECLLLLIYPTISDIRIRKFYIEPVMLISAFFVVMRILRQQAAASDILIGCLPGLTALGLCLITGQAIGEGDAAVITGLGIIAGWRNACCICFIGLVLCGLTGLLLIILKKAGRKTVLPFVPFLMIAVLILWWIRV